MLSFFFFPDMRRVNERFIKCVKITYDTEMLQIVCVRVSLTHGSP